MNHVQTPPCHAHTPVPSSHIHHHPHHHHHPHSQVATTPQQQQQHQQSASQQRLTVSPPSDCLLSSQSALVLGASSGDVMSAGPSSGQLHNSSLTDGKELSTGNVSHHHQQQQIHTVYSTSPSPHVTSPATADVSPTLDRFRQQYPVSQHRVSPSTPPCSLGQIRLLGSQHQSSIGFTVKPEYAPTASSSSPSQSPLSCSGGTRPNSSLPLQVITSATMPGNTRGHVSSVEATGQLRKCEVLTDDDDYYDGDDDEDAADEAGVGSVPSSLSHRGRSQDCPSHQALHYHPQHHNNRLGGGGGSGSGAGGVVVSMVATDLRTHCTPPSSMLSTSGGHQLSQPCSQQLSIDYANSSHLSSSAGVVSSSSGGGLLSGIPLLSPAHYPSAHLTQPTRHPNQQQRDSFSASSMISPGSHEIPVGSSGPPSSQGMPTDFDLVEHILPNNLTHQPHHQPANQTFSGISPSSCGINVLPITAAANTSELTGRGLSRDPFHGAPVLPTLADGVTKARRYSLPYEMLIGGDGNGNGVSAGQPVMPVTNNGSLKLPVNQGNLDVLEQCGTQISPSSSIVTRSSGPNGLGEENGHTPTNLSQRLVQPLDFTSFQHQQHHQQQHHQPPPQQQHHSHHQHHHHSTNGGPLAVVNGTRCFSTPVPLGVSASTAGRGTSTGEELLHAIDQHFEQHQNQNEVPLPGFNSPESAFYQYQHRMEGQRCQVCGELAAGFHHGAYVCEACKKFFMRHSLTDTKPTNVCPTGGNCVVAKGSRGKCQICRFRKCLLVGMRMKDPDSQPEVDISNIPCRVCGGRSSGFHFGALTCEGCKGFFRRTEGSAGSLVCVGGQNACTITPRSRNACKSCRFRRCLAAGMSKKGSRIGRQPNAVKFHCAIEIRQLQSIRGKLQLHPLASSSGDCLTKPSSSSNSTPYPHGLGGSSGCYPSDLLSISRPPSSLQHRGGGLAPDDEDDDADEEDEEEEDEEVVVAAATAASGIDGQQASKFSPLAEHQQKAAGLLPLGFGQHQLLAHHQHQQVDSSGLLSPWLLGASSTVPPTIPVVPGANTFLADQKPPAPTASLFLLLPPSTATTTSSSTTTIANSNHNSQVLSDSSNVLDMVTVSNSQGLALASLSTVASTTCALSPTAATRLTSPAGATGAMLQSVTKAEPITPGQPSGEEYPTNVMLKDPSGDTDNLDGREVEVDVQQQPHHHHRLLHQQQQVEEDMSVSVSSDGQAGPAEPPSGKNAPEASVTTSSAVSVPSLLAPLDYYYRHYCQQQPMDWGTSLHQASPVTTGKPAPVVLPFLDDQHQSVTVHHHRQQQQEQQQNAVVTASLIASLARQLTNADEETMRELTASPPPAQDAILRFSDGMRTATEFLRLPNTYFKNRFRMTSIPLDREESSCRIWGHMMNHFHMHAQQIVQFAKLVPGFNQLGITARSSLVRGGMYPVVLLLLSRDYQPESDEYNYFDFTSDERAVIMRHFPTFLRFTEHLRMAGLLLHHLGLNLPELSLASAVEILRNYHILEEPTRASTKELFVLAYHTLQTCITHRNHAPASTWPSTSGAGDQHRWEQFLGLSRMIQEMNREHHQILASLKDSRSDLHFPELYIEMFQLADSASALFASAAAAVSSCSAKAAVVSSMACSTAVAALRLCTAGVGADAQATGSPVSQSTAGPLPAHTGASLQSGYGQLTRAEDAVPAAADVSSRMEAEPTANSSGLAAAPDSQVSSPTSHLPP